MTDNEVLSEIGRASKFKEHVGHTAACRIAGRDHFRVLYQRNPDDIRKNPEAATAVYEAARKEFGEAVVRLDSWKEKGESLVFPVATKDGRIVPSLEISDVLMNVPLVAVDFVFVAAEALGAARLWLQANRERIIEEMEADET
jgi:hypothetical protein